MAKREEIKKVVILGSGPIVIGQACEFDYSGTQACKALMAQGLEVILINSNPATIMTDPEISTRVYVEPLRFEFVKKILEKEKPDAIIPTLGGQTALNLALELDSKGVLKELGIEMLGAKPEVIRAAEDREEFRDLLDRIGAHYPQSFMIRSHAEGLKVVKDLGLPIILRPNYTLGGGGGGIAYSMEEYEKKLATALQESPTSEVLVEESVLGWKEFELEVMRDCEGTFVVICSIENIDPCGVHTGDSITVAPQQTLTERAYQEMRDEACKILNAVGVETGGANVQFAVCQKTGKRVVIEMNPRVSRSSALASKATGFPIAKIAALLSIGYRLEEITNDITRSTPSCYEPALDYVVTKIPRFAFEKFSGTQDVLTTQMKSVGEVMSIGRTLKESLMKAMLALESSPEGIEEVPYLEKKISYPNSGRFLQLFQAFREGKTMEEVHALTQIAPWFLEQIEDLIKEEQTIKERVDFTNEDLLHAKRLGFSDARLAKLTERKTEEVRHLRWKLGISPGYEQVDTCAGEFAAETPYYYSTYWKKPSPMHSSQTIVVMGSGPNRIGQGIEFDYSCVRGVKAFQKEGYQVAMVNSNPETVSTDYDTSDRLFFEPLTEEHVLEVLRHLEPKGFVAQLGGQTPINIAPQLVEEGFQLLGSSIETVDLAEDRGRFSKLCRELNFEIPAAAMAKDLEQAKSVVEGIGFPIICRPNYVLGGRRMEVVESMEELELYFKRHGAFINAKNQCLMDQFLGGALEVDVDMVCGDGWSIIGGVVEHIEAAGVHSGDSMGVIPPQRLKESALKKIEALSTELGEKLGIRGYLNLQLAIKDNQIYMLEANPRSSRSVPFVAKSTGIPLVDLGVKAILGQSREEVQPEKYHWRALNEVCVKGVVFPFKKFPDADSILGPEMKSTGECMGRGADYAEALLKACHGGQVELPLSGEVFLSLRDKDKKPLLGVIKNLVEMGYHLSATQGTAQFLEENHVPCTLVKKVHEGRPHCVDRIRSGDVAFVINTTSGRRSVEASFSIRRSCIDYAIPCITESDAAEVFSIALQKQRLADFNVTPL